MIERVKGNNKVLKMTLIGIVSFILIFSIGSMIFIKILYDREFPRFDKPNPAFMGYLMYSDVEAEYDREVVEFKSGKNTLKGYIYGRENDKGLVVIAHGIGGGAESYLSEALYFVDNGWRVFAYDCTGSHESEGESTVGLAQSVIDLDAALSYVESNGELKDLPVMLYGHSWGGYAVASILNYDHDIAASVSIAGFN